MRCSDSPSARNARNTAISVEERERVMTVNGRWPCSCAGASALRASTAATCNCELRAGTLVSIKAAAAADTWWRKAVGVDGEEEEEERIDSMTPLARAAMLCGCREGGGDSEGARWEQEHPSHTEGCKAETGLHIHTHVPPFRHRTYRAEAAEGIAQVLQLLLQGLQGWQRLLLLRLCVYMEGEGRSSVSEP